jgi:hypothetical protein
MMLFMSPQSMPRGQPFNSEAWRMAFVTYLREWSRHLQEIGVPYDAWALYPYDEPSTPYGETTRNLVTVARLIRQADPQIRIYTDPTSGTTMETIELLEGLIDIWCPSAELLERVGDELVPALRRRGKEIWFYDAAGSARTLSCLGIYRWRFWHAWNRGFTGAGWWVYKSGDYQWDGLNPTGDYFCTVYPTGGDIVPSKRWEVAREGVEDYELLYLLRELIREAEERGGAEGAVAEAKRLLEELPRRIESALWATGRRLPLVPDSVPVYAEATRSVQEARRQMIAACLRLKRQMAAQRPRG